MKLTDLIINNIKVEKEVYLSLPFTKESDVSFVEKENYHFFLNLEEINHFKNIYFKHKLSIDEICFYLTYYVTNNIHHPKDVISSNISFDELLQNLNYYTDYDAVYSLQQTITKSASFTIVRVHSSNYKQDTVFYQFITVDLLKHLVQIYKDYNYDHLKEAIIYFQKNLTYKPDQNIKVTQIFSVSDLIDNLESFYPEMNIYLSERSFNAIPKVIWTPDAEIEKQNEAMEIGNKLKEQGYFGFNTVPILLEWKEDYINLLKKLSIVPTTSLIVWLLLYYDYFDYLPPNKTIVYLSKLFKDENIAKSFSIDKILQVNRMLNVGNY